jgi:RimJ/RimL family protein N-acetyltransferase
VNLTAPDPPLADDTIRFEPIEDRHLADFIALAEDPDVVRFTRLPPERDEQYIGKWIARYCDGWVDGSRAGFAVVAGANGAFLGMAALITIDWDASEAEIGYVIAPSARGRGVARRALRLIAAWALDGLGLERVEARVDVANQASRKVVERAGFSRDGVLRGVYFKPAVRCDMAVYSLLPDDPRPRYA